MSDTDLNTSSSCGVSLQWGGFSFTLNGDASLIREGFILLRSDVFPSLFAAGPPAPEATVEKGVEPEQKSVSLDPGAGVADEVPNPAAFVEEKQPKTEVEKAVVLAYYGRRYRSLDEFTVEQLEALHNEAHVPIVNVNNAIGNASRKAKGGLIRSVPGKRGAYQLTAAGESYVKTKMPRKG